MWRKDASTRFLNITQIISAFIFCVLPKDKMIPGLVKPAPQHSRIPLFLCHQLSAEFEPWLFSFSFSFLPSLCPSLSFPSQSAPPSGEKKAASCPFVQLAGWIGTPGKISEIQLQCGALDRAESQIRSEGSLEERGSNPSFMLLSMCDKTSTEQQRCSLCWPQVRRRRAH